MCVSSTPTIPDPPPPPAPPAPLPIQKAKSIESAPTLKKTLLTEGGSSILAKLRIPLNIPGDK